MLSIFAIFAAFNAAYAGTVPLMPIAATDVAVRWDGLYGFLFWISVFFFVLVIGAMLYFAFQYQDRPGIKTRYIRGSHLLEAMWIAIPTLLLLGIFGWGFSVYREMREAPLDAYEIRVIGKQWLWNFQYDNGRMTTNELYVPMNRPVKLVMTSEDVIHDFFIPNFRIKQDVVPGMFTSVWFEARIPGKHQVYCGMYCGTSHSGMLAQVIALNDEQWKDWLAGKKLPPIPMAGQALTQADRAQAERSARLTQTASLADQGRHVFESKGCVSCHALQGAAKIGPTLQGLYGRKVDLADGSSVVADDNYVRDSIENPQSQLVRGYSPLMPTFKGLLKPAELNALVAFVKTLK